MEYYAHSLRILCLNNNLCQKKYTYLVLDLSKNYDFKVILNESVFCYVCDQVYLRNLGPKNRGVATIRAGAIIGTNTVYSSLEILVDF